MEMQCYVKQAGTLPSYRPLEGHLSISTHAIGTVTVRVIRILGFAIPCNIQVKTRSVPWHSCV